MQFNEYQEKIREFRVPSYTPEASVMGLLAESGEVAAVFQKLIRGDYSQGQAAQLLEKELGDILWHISAVADDNGWNLQDISQMNINKLESRKLRNVILGAGDNR